MSDQKTEAIRRIIERIATLKVELGEVLRLEEDEAEELTPFQIEINKFYEKYGDKR